MLLTHLIIILPRSENKTQTPEVEQLPYLHPIFLFYRALLDHRRLKEVFI